MQKDKNAQALGARGGRARWAKMTEEERKAYSEMMNKKRWPNGAKKKITKKTEEHT